MLDNPFIGLMICSKCGARAHGTPNVNKDWRAIDAKGGRWLRYLACPLCHPAADAPSDQWTEWMIAAVGELITLNKKQPFKKLLYWRETGQRPEVMS